MALSRDAIIQAVTPIVEKRINISPDEAILRDIRDILEEVVDEMLAAGVEFEEPLLDQQITAICAEVGKGFNGLALSAAQDAQTYAVLASGFGVRVSFNIQVDIGPAEASLEPMPSSDPLPDVILPDPEPEAASEPELPPDEVDVAETQPAEPEAAQEAPADTPEPVRSQDITDALDKLDSLDLNVVVWFISRSISDNDDDARESFRGRMLEDEASKKNAADLIELNVKVAGILAEAELMQEAVAHQSRAIEIRESFKKADGPRVMQLQQGLKRLRNIIDGVPVEEAPTPAVIDRRDVPVGPASGGPVEKKQGRRERDGHYYDIVGIMRDEWNTPDHGRYIEFSDALLAPEFDRRTLSDLRRANVAAAKFFFKVEEWLRSKMHWEKVLYLQDHPDAPYNLETEHYMEQTRQYIANMERKLAAA